jgi:acetyl esterase/lipase
LAIDKEGPAPARRLNQSGVTAFVLNYRLPADGWASGYDAPVQDIQRAIRLVRARAATWNLDIARIGVMGFSAGGNLAAAAVSVSTIRSTRPSTPQTAFRHGRTSPVSAMPP